MPWTPWRTRTTRPSRTTWVCEDNNCTNPSGNFGHLSTRNTFDTVGQSMMQLARAQDQTNKQLQQHIQQGQVNLQAHTGALQQLAVSTYQRNFDHIYASIPIYDGSDREGFFPWFECLEAACFYSGRISRLKLWEDLLDQSRM